MSIMKTTRKHPWVWSIPVVLLIVGLLTLFAWWQYYKTTPTYALAALVNAVQENDAAAFDQVVDIDRVIDNFVTQGTPTSAGISPEMTASLRKGLQMLSAQTMNGIRELVKAEIRKRTSELAGSSKRPFMLTALAMPFAVDSKQTGNAVQVRVKGTDQVELVLENAYGTNWRIVSVRDEAIAPRVIDGIVKNFPTSDPHVDREIRRQLQTLPETLQTLPLLNPK